MLSLFLPCPSLATARITHDGGAIITTSTEDGSVVELLLPAAFGPWPQAVDLAAAIDEACGWTRWLGCNPARGWHGSSYTLYSPTSCHNRPIRVTDRGAPGSFAQALAGCHAGRWSTIAYVRWQYDHHAADLYPWETAALDPVSASEIPNDSGATIVPFSVF